MFTSIRKLYDWVLSLAETPYGSIALFILAFSEASFFPIPPDVLLIALALGSRSKSFKFALICSIASISGGIAGYGIGHFLWWNGDSYNMAAHFFFNNIPGFSEELFLNIKEQYDIHGFIIIFTAGFTPIPYKLFTITAGAFKISFPSFLIATIISRSARFFLVSYLIRKYGEKVKDFIDQYFNLLTGVFIVMLVGGYVLIKYVFI